jgi:hypothetical protein
MATFRCNFHSGAGLSSGDVRCILVQPDDRMLVGGTSGTFNGIAKTNAKITSSGVYDPTFSKFKRLVV